MRKSERTAKALIVAELRQRYPLKELLKLSGIARSTFYYYLKLKDVDKYKEAKDDILDIFNENKGRYGYRRISTALKQKVYVSGILRIIVMLAPLR